MAANGQPLVVTGNAPLALPPFSHAPIVPSWVYPASGAAVAVVAATALQASRGRKLCLLCTTLAAFGGAWLGARLTADARV